MSDDQPPQVPDARGEPSKGDGAHEADTAPTTTERVPAGVSGALLEKAVADNPELRFKILDAEYRHVTSMLMNIWSTSAARTNLFFVAVSAAGVALALFANGPHATATFLLLVLAVLLLVLVMGVVALERMLHANREAVLYMQSVNRIRRYFTELDPGSVAYMTLPTTDDFAGLFGTHRPRSSFGAMTQMPAASMATLIALIDAFVTAAVVGTAYLLIAGASQWGAVVAAGIALAISIAAYEGWAYRDLQKMRQSLDIRFPTRTKK